LAQPGHDFEQRGLSRAGASEYSDHLAARFQIGLEKERSLAEMKIL
jgi:hypothetical protein